jgi:acetoin utilization protein AcuB
MKKTMEMIMTKMPRSIGFDIKIGMAEEQMKKFQIRHLPVLKGGKIVGILTDRDLKLAAKFGSKDLNVEEIMTLDPYVVELQSSVSEVLAKMAEHKYGAVIVEEKGKAVGIFTAVDGMRLLSELYR